MDGDMEYRPDHMQHPDGCVAADLMNLHYGDIYYRRSFLHYWTHCASFVVLAIINWEQKLNRISFLNRMAMQALNISR